MIKMRDIDPFEAVFTHIGEDKTSVLCVASQRLVAAPEFLELEIVRTPVDREFGRWAMENRGIEEHRLERITVAAIMTSPIAYIHMPDHTHLLVDGSHRYVKASMLGFQTILARVVPEEIWRKYEIEPMPLGLAKMFTSGFSGIM